MNRQFVSCASITNQPPDPFILYHQPLGCFESDRHQHPWGQLVYAEQGYVHLDSEGKKRLLPSWYGAWIPPNTDHAVWSNSPNLMMRAICLPVTSTDLLDQPVTIFAISPLLREMIRYTERWSNKGNQEQPVRTFLQALEEVLPDELKRAVPVCLPTTQHEKLETILVYIRGHLSESISSCLVADRFGLSVRSLSRLFAQQLGTSFASYCRLARVALAYELIQQGTDNVSLLAESVGYASMATFSNNFTDICGYRPLQAILKRKAMA